jgi:hypothetical protein
MIDSGTWLDVFLMRQVLMFFLSSAVLLWNRVHEYTGGVTTRDAQNLCRRVARQQKEVEIQRAFPLPPGGMMLNVA